MKRHLTTLVLTLTLFPLPSLAQTAPSPTETKPLTTNRALTPMEGTKQLQIQLVNCHNPFDCWLAERLLPQSTFITTRQLQFGNTSATPINILSTTIVAEGKLTGFQLSPKQLTLPPTQTLSPNQISNLPLSLNRSNIPPDQYTGNIYLVIGNQAEWISLPINLSVRTGPLFPLTILIWGILLGRLLKYMQDRGEPQAKVLQEINELEYELRSLDPQDQAILSKVITQARRTTYREQYDAAKTQIKTVRDRLDVLTNLRTLENKLEQRVEPISDQDVNQAIEGIQSARSAVLEAEDATARAGIQQVQNLLNSSGVGAKSASRKPTATQAAIQNVTDSLDVLGKEGSGEIVSTSPSFMNGLQRSLIVLSGVSDRARAEATFWVVRPLLALVLLAGLSAVGLGSLYVEKGNTFGANPFSDYLGLILWGLSADVASRSLSNLKDKQGG